MERSSSWAWAEAAMEGLCPPIGALELKMEGAHEGIVKGGKREGRKRRLDDFNHDR